MTDAPSHDAQQCAIHMAFGLIPIVKVRKAVPSDSYTWEWGRWRFAKLAEIVVLNAMLMQTWRK